MTKNNKDYRSLILGGGCFWCLEAAFERVRGVNKVISGYAGGKTENPTYDEVSYEDTGHAEVVKIKFNPSEISTRELLDIFFTIHDPTTLNRQGSDVGSQYRSIVLYQDEKQKEEAENAISRFNQDVWDGEIVTELKPLRKFYEAEEYHQNYYEKNPSKAYCQTVISPKLNKLASAFEDKLK